MMPLPARSPWLRYGSAVAAVALMTGVRSALDPFTGQHQPFLVYYLAVIFAAWYGGLGPSVLAVVLGCACATFFFLPPYSTLLIRDSVALTRVGMYFVVSAALVAFGESGRSARRRLEEEIAERVRAGQAERAQRERLQTTLSSVGDGVIVTDAEGRVVSLNPVAEGLTGWATAEAEGRPLKAVFRTVDRETQKTEELPVLQVVGGGVSRRMDRTALIPKGGAGAGLAIEHCTAPIQDERGSVGGVVIVFHDVTERRAAEETLRESEGRLRRLADAMPQIVWTAGPDGSVDYFNGRWYEYTGLPQDGSLGGEGWRAVIHPDDVGPLVEARYRAVAAGGDFECEARLRDSRGAYRWHLVRSRPVTDDAGRVARRFGAATDIDDRKRTEDALRASEQRFRNLAEAIPQIVWISRPDYWLEYLNRRWFDYTGLSCEESFHPDGWLLAVHPDDAAKVAAAGEWSRATGEPFEAEYRLKGRDGVYRWHLGRSVELTDGAGRVVTRFGTATDIDGRKRAEDAARFLAGASASLAVLEDEVGTLNQVADLAVPAFADWCAVDMAGEDGMPRRLTVAHPDPAKLRLAHELAERYPVDPGSAVGVPQVLRSGVPEIVPEITDAILAAGARDEEHLRILRELGLRSYMCVPLTGRGGTLGAITFVAAESGRVYGPDDLRLAEDLGRRAATAVENARLYDRLKEADRRKDEFLATLAHELRNPLAPIRNALHLMKHRDGDSPFPQADVEVERAMAERQVTHLARLVDDLMDVSRINRGKIELRRERVRLEAVVRRAVESVGQALRDRGHELTVSLPDAPVSLEVDPTRLEQVLWNLLNNAIKYTEPGGRIWLSAARDGGEALVTVRDSGIGIEPAVLPHVFEMFVQAEHRSDRAQGGLGIGLSLVKTLVEMHGGSIAAHSEGRGRGTEVVVRLPALPEADAPDDTQAPAEPARGEGKIPRRRVLVVDDNVDAATSLARVLTRLYGQEVSVAHDGPTALSMAEGFRPEVVFLDIGMPGMDGYEVATTLRGRAEFRSTLLVALTGWGQTADRERSKEVGFDRHMVKPVAPEELTAILAGAGAGEGGGGA